MDKLTREQVLHVADLGRLALTEDEIEKSQSNLKKILDEIEKILDVDIDEHTIMVSPTINTNIYRSDEVKDMLKLEDVLKGAPKTNGQYIEIPRVLNDD